MSTNPNELTIENSPLLVIDHQLAIAMITRRFAVPETINRTTTAAAHIRLTRRSPQYWRVTIDHPPLNIFGPDRIPELNEIITALETDNDVTVVGYVNRSLPDSDLETFCRVPCNPHRIVRQAGDQ